MCTYKVIAFAYVQCERLPAYLTRALDAILCSFDVSKTGLTTVIAGGEYASIPLTDSKHRLRAEPSLREQAVGVVTGGIAEMFVSRRKEKLTYIRKGFAHIAIKVGQQNDADNLMYGTVNTLLDAQATMTCRAVILNSSSTRA